MRQVCALIIDDEAAAREELRALLRAELGMSCVETARSSAEALRQLRQRRFDLVFTEIQLPGLNGIELASVLRQFAEPPAIVFVTAHDEYALQAFEVGACDYLLKPASRPRLAIAVSRAIERAPARAAADRDAGHPVAGYQPDDPAATITVESGGRVRLISRDAVHWVEARGDYVRLHMAYGEAHLVRIPISRLEDMWADSGFMRIHRSYLVALRYVSEFSVANGHHAVRVAGESLPVSRRHARELRDTFRKPARRR